MGSFFNSAVNTFVDGFKSFFNGSLLAAISDIAEAFYKYTPWQIHALLGVYVLAALLWTINKVRELILEVLL